MMLLLIFLVKGYLMWMGASGGDDGLAFDMQVSTLKDLRNIPNIQNSLSSGTQKLIFLLLIL